MAMTSKRDKPVSRKTIFQRMERSLLRISSDLNPDAVHGFRTTSRRVQTLLQDLLPERTRNQKKLLEILSQVRKRSGKVRDIDVQLAALRSLKTSQEPRRKTQLMHRLIELRAKHESKFSKLLKKNGIREVKRRLRKASKEVSSTSLRDPLAEARKILETGKSSVTPPSDEALHQYRLSVKRARYAAEFAVPSDESAEFIAQLKKAQDALGHWHDWALLTRTAAENFGEVHESSLVAALQNVTRGKFRQAIPTLPVAPPAQARRAPSLASTLEPRQSAA
jgi:CHAD domain-containing protein